MTRQENELLPVGVARIGAIGYAGHYRRRWLYKISDTEWALFSGRKKYSYKSLRIAPM